MTASNPGGRTAENSRLIGMTVMGAPYPHTGEPEITLTLRLPASRASQCKSCHLHFKLKRKGKGKPLQKGTSNALELPSKEAVASQGCCGRAEPWPRKVGQAPPVSASTGCRALLPGAHLGPPARSCCGSFLLAHGCGTTISLTERKHFILPKCLAAGIL